MAKQSGMANTVAFHKLSLGGNNSKTQHAMTVNFSPCNSATIGVSSDVHMWGANPISFGAFRVIASQRQLVKCHFISHPSLVRHNSPENRVSGARRATPQDCSQVFHKTTCVALSSSVLDNTSPIKLAVCQGRLLAGWRHSVRSLRTPGSETNISSSYLLWMNAIEHLTGVKYKINEYIGLSSDRPDSLQSPMCYKIPLMLQSAKIVLNTFNAKIPDTR